jgi:hypothetical protein
MVHSGLFRTGIGFWDCLQVTLQYQPKAGWKQDIAVFGALALADEDLATAKIHFANLDLDQLADPYCGQTIYGRKVAGDAPSGFALSWASARALWRCRPRIRKGLL